MAVSKDNKTVQHGSGKVRAILNISGVAETHELLAPDMCAMMDLAKDVCKGLGKNFKRLEEGKDSFEVQQGAK